MIVSDPVSTKRQDASSKPRTTGAPPPKPPKKLPKLAQTRAPTEVSAADVEGAIFCPYLAQQLIGLHVEIDFPGHGSFSGMVVGSEPVIEFGGAFLHAVRFSDGDTDEYSYLKIIAAHEQYLANHSLGGPTSHVLLQPLPRPCANHGDPTATPPTDDRSPLNTTLQLPASYSNYPIRLPVDGVTVQAQIVERRIDPSGLHQWRLLLPAPYSDRETWVDTQTLHRSFDEARRRSKIAAPATKTPTLTPLLDFSPPFAENHRWTTNHPLVGLVTTAFLSSTIPPTSPSPPNSPKKRRPKETHCLTVEAVYQPTSAETRAGAKPQFWARVHSNQRLSALFLDPASLAEASHASDVDRLSTRNRRRRPFRHHISPANGGATPVADAPCPDVSPGNTNFAASLASLEARIGNDAKSFFGAGFRIAAQAIPRSVVPLYRRGLSLLAREIAAQPDSAPLWHLLLHLYDGLILGPFPKSQTFGETIRMRMALFLAGEWDELFEEHLQRRDPGNTAPPTPPQSDDPDDARAARAQHTLLKHADVGKAASALRAPVNPRPAQVGDHTRAFRKLNPLPGDIAPRPKTYTCPLGGGDVPERHLPRNPDPPPILRRALDPPADVPPPEPIQFTSAQIIKRVRRSSNASAGGLSGTNYRGLRHWFFDDDDISKNLTAAINLMVAGRIPASVLPFLNAGRGVAIPKNDEGELRPIVVGHVLLRLIGSLAMSALSGDIQRYFLQPDSALQFGVGVQGGCELMAMAIATHMEEHPDHVDISCDARNAFNTWCRTRLWGTLRERFPSIYAVVKLMYGEAADVVFYEDGAGLERIFNAVGSRQGCSLGSFLYCLAIHPYLQLLKSEFPDLTILSYCDDVHILGPPSRAIMAYKRWAQIYCTELQGELRDDKGMAFAPQLTKADLIGLGMPDDMQHTNSGTRILGAPVGCETYWVEYASNIVCEIERDFEVLGRIGNFQAQHIIACKSLVHRINHLLRNVPGGESFFDEVAARYDTCVLSVVRRVCSSPLLPDIARRIAHLPTGMGGLGLRSWKSTADAAFVAAYANAAEALPALLPSCVFLSKRLPTTQAIYETLSATTPGGPPTALAPSRLAYFASRALARLNSRAPGVHEVLRLRDNRSPSHLQHRLTELISNADLLLVKGEIEAQDTKEYPWRSALFNSNCGDPYSFNTVPKDKTTTITDNLDFAVMCRLH